MRIILKIKTTQKAHERGLKFTHYCMDYKYSYNMIPNNLVFSEKKYRKKKDNASGFSTLHRHGRRHFFHTTPNVFLWGIGKQTCRPDETQQNTVSDQSLHCLLTVHCLLIECSIKIKKIENATQHPLKGNCLVQLSGEGLFTIWRK